MAVSWHRAKRKQIVWLLMKSLGNQPDTAKWGRSLTLPIAIAGLLCAVTANRPCAGPRPDVLLPGSRGRLQCMGLIPTFYGPPEAHGGGPLGCRPWLS